MGVISRHSIITYSEVLTLHKNHLNVKTRRVLITATCASQFTHHPTHAATTSIRSIPKTEGHPSFPALALGHPCIRSWDHYNDVIVSAMSSLITSLTIVYSTVYPGADQRKHQHSTSLAFVRGIHRSPVNSLHKGPVSRKMFPFDHVNRPAHVIMVAADLLMPGHQ